jgi:uncharacterized protein
MRAFLTLIAALLALYVAPAQAAPTFPALTGRVVDEANILSPATEQAIEQESAALEQKTGRQFVVATLKSLRGLEIEDYGYQLGRAWGIGSKDKNDGALLIVAPNERSVRIEVGYGLEGVLTDALSSTIIQGRILPRFRAGDMDGGVKAGADAVVEQLGLDPTAAEARVQQATAQASREQSPDIGTIIFIVFIILVLSGMFGRRRGGLGALWPLIFMGGGGGRDDRWGGGGWGGGGGGGFSGGGGSFGGGGASGRW